MQGSTTNDLRNIMANIRTNLRKNDVEAEIQYRLKDPYSVLQKMLRKNIEVKKLTDLIGFRIIVNKQYDCYKVLVTLYNIYPVNMGKTKDYIADPKDNGYRSLHLVVIADIYDRNIEIQIRTRRMHNIAEFGIANHEEYKKTQEEKLRKLFYEERLNTVAINDEINEAYDIFNQFNWTISELIAYEQAIENLWRKFQNNS
ncbi:MULTISPECIES: bifunctional (p)ppGpp synthetase/guanosine-3',5'-bis(diphosphate) 3'-pyrophosphohydrolase [unclassified Candidatus Tisiphia]|jgi:(p)ppGpp synthase/HD superfamily hydrolase|uniref:bifunctional (p)ppGpp synthetase/guanosine-3',5'-bis(diphosphate) 3'-pyrophosphohydrolase n=1 Tax=unclassified Candidatus Tisiphia TaxID=2996318 RepID=UPI001E777031|nr:MAG: bifunctional (p)ppGpp synthetase/guanosine-3',5'-bis(diphosphate) 3'-pyrophosphohydrolase [Rickettsia endosymbiont of Cimex lectularius]